MAFKDFVGYGRETGHIYRLSELGEAKRKGNTWAPHIIKAVESSMPVVESVGLERYLLKDFGDKKISDIAQKDLVSRIKSFSAYSRKMKGSMYAYSVVEVFKAIFTEDRGFLVFPELKVQGKKYDVAIVNDNVWIYVEISKDVGTWEKEVVRHNNEPFYFVTPGYDLKPLMVNEMSSKGCLPVFTYGCACKGVISIDQLITEIRDLLTRNNEEVVSESENYQSSSQM
jgi:hypothetical protein